jgi:hypothetical protein
LFLQVGIALLRTGIIESGPALTRKQDWLVRLATGGKCNTN